jgi:hypothetical protein
MTAQDEMQDRMSKMAQKRGGRPRNLSVAEKVALRKGLKEDKRDAMRSLISGGEPTNSVSGKVGKIRRLRRKRRSK